MYKAGVTVVPNHLLSYDYGFTFRVNICYWKVRRRTPLRRDIIAAKRDHIALPAGLRRF